MRNLSPALSVALTDDAIRPAFLCELDLGMHIIHAWSHPGELEWHGRKFGNAKAISQIIGGVSNVEESGEAKASGLTYFISGIDPESNEGRELVSIAQSQVKRGGVCNLWFATLTETGALDGEPFLVASTLVDFPLIQIRPDGIAILLQTETRRVRHRARRGRRTTHEDHQLDHPGDMFYEFKNELQDKTI